MTLSGESSIGAVLSDCGCYRYALTRGGWLDGEGTVLFVMLNPSTADATADDPTIRRCIRFAHDWGYARLTVANLYALRATDPRELGLAADPVGPLNDYWLSRLGGEATGIVAAWGASPFATPERVDRAVHVLENWHRQTLQCLGQTKALAPRHPLYVRADKRPEPFRRLARVA